MPPRHQNTKLHQIKKFHAKNAKKE